MSDEYRVIRRMVRYANGTSADKFFIQERVKYFFGLIEKYEWILDGRSNNGSGRRICLTTYEAVYKYLELLTDNPEIVPVIALK